MINHHAKITFFSNSAGLGFENGLVAAGGGLDLALKESMAVRAGDGFVKKKKKITRIKGTKKS